MFDAREPLRCLTRLVRPWRLGRLLAVLAVIALALALGRSTAQPASGYGSGQAGSAAARPEAQAPDDARILRGLAAQSDADPVIAAAGDIACDPQFQFFNGGVGSSTYCHEQYTSNLFLSQSFAAILPLGDIQYWCDGPAAFDVSYNPTWGRVRAITHPATGNHEYYTSGGTGCDTTGHGTGYFNYFGASAGDPSKGYYSYDIGTWHLIALNTNCAPVGGCGPGSPQEQWLRNDLSTHQSTCTLAYFHYPLFSSKTPLSASSTFWKDLYAAGADVVLSAHVHNYERFAAQTPTGAYDPGHGIVEFVVGTGGMSLEGFPSTIAPNSRGASGSPQASVANSTAATSAVPNAAPTDRENCTEAAAAPSICGPATLCTLICTDTCTSRTASSSSRTVATATRSPIRVRDRATARPARRIRRRRR